MVHLPNPNPTPQFRNYEENPTTDHQRRVKDFYYKQHSSQTVDFVLEMVCNYCLSLYYSFYVKEINLNKLTNITLIL